MPQASFRVISIYLEELLHASIGMMFNEKLKKNNCLIKKYIASMFIPTTNDQEKQCFLSSYGDIMNMQTEIP